MEIIHYKAWSWNPQDLEQAKNIVCQMSFVLPDEEIYGLQDKGYFGNLDVQQVLEED